MRLTVGMPLYNTAERLPSVIESVLNQTFSDFEFIIVDNCSTDGSYEIAIDYAKKDSRIRVYRNYRNLGGFLNFEKIHRMPCAEYFCQKSSDDVLEPTYFEELIDVLDNRKDVSLVFSNADNVPEGDKLFSIDSDDPLERGIQSVQIPFYGHFFYGIVRKGVFDELIAYRLQGNDHPIFLQFALSCKCVYVDKKLYGRYLPPDNLASRKRYLEVCSVSVGDNSYEMPSIKWLEIFLGFMRVIQSMDINTDKIDYARKIFTESRYLNYDNLVGDYEKLIYSYRCLVKNKKLPDYYFLLIKRKLIITEYESYLKLLPDFFTNYRRRKTHEFLSSIKGKIKKVIRIFIKK